MPSCTQRCGILICRPETVVFSFVGKGLPCSFFYCNKNVLYHPDNIVIFHMNFAGISHEAIQFIIHVADDFSRPKQINRYHSVLHTPTTSSRVKPYVPSSISYARRDEYLSQNRVPDYANQLLSSLATVHSRGSTRRLSCHHLGWPSPSEVGVRSCTATDWAWPS